MLLEPRRRDLRSIQRRKLHDQLFKRAGTPPLDPHETGDPAGASGGVTLLRTPGGPFPFALLGSPTRPAVDPVDLAPAVAALWSAHVDPLLGEGVRVVIEGGNPYGRGGVIVSAAAVALQHAARLGDRLHVLCEIARVPVQHVVAATWRARVVPRDLRGQGVDKLGRARTFIQDAHVRAALALYLSPLDVAALASRDERDAAGAVIGVVLAEEDDARKATPRVRVAPPPREPRAPRASRGSKAPRSLADRMADAQRRAAVRGDVPAKVAPCPRGCGRPRSGPGSAPHVRGLPCPP